MLIVGIQFIKAFPAAGAATSGTLSDALKAGTERDLPVRGRVRARNPRMQCHNPYDPDTPEAQSRVGPVLGMDVQYAVDAAGRGRDNFFRRTGNCSRNGPE